MEPQEIEFEVTNLMQELQKNEKELEVARFPYMKIIEDASNIMNDVSSPFNIKSAEIQEKIKKLILIREHSLKTGSGNITYRKGATRRTWDLDKLDTICDFDPYIKTSIWNLRKETIGEPSVTIKVDTKGTSITDI